MRAVIYVKQKGTDKFGDLTEVVVWKVSISDQHPQGVRYRLAFVPKGYSKPAVLYDNHHPKGHHKHIGHSEFSYDFRDVHQLIFDFKKDINGWKSQNKQGRRQI